MKKFLILISLTFILILPGIVRAAINPAQQDVSVFLDQNTVGRGYTLQSADKNLFLGIWQGVLNKPTRVEIKKISREMITPPEDKVLVSDLYIFDFKERIFDDFKQLYTLALKYESDSQAHKAIYFYNPGLEKWSEVLPVEVKQEYKTVRVQLKFSYAQIAVLEDKSEEGMASWYKYRGGLFAAHPVYPKGAELKVTNLDNDKSVIVTVNDWGPDRTIHPERVVDLDSVAFKQIGCLCQGVIRVKVEKL